MKHREEMVRERFYKILSLLTALSDGLMFSPFFLISSIQMELGKGPKGERGGVGIWIRERERERERERD
jgi:hypothetical protein